MKFKTFFYHKNEVVNIFLKKLSNLVGIKKKRTSTPNAPRTLYDEFQYM